MDQSNHITRKKPNEKSTTYDREASSHTNATSPVRISNPVVPNVVLSGPSDHVDRSSLRIAMCVPQRSAHEKTVRYTDTVYGKIYYAVRKLADDVQKFSLFSNILVELLENFDIPLNHQTHCFLVSPTEHLEKTKEDFCSVVAKCYCNLVKHWLVMKPDLKFKDLLDFVNGDTICEELRLFLIQHNAMKRSSEPLVKRVKRDCGQEVSLEGGMKDYQNITTHTKTNRYTDIYSAIVKLAANKQKFANFSALLATFLESFEVPVCNKTYRHLASPIEHLEKERESSCIVLTQCYCKLVEHWLLIKPDLPSEDIKNFVNGGTECIRLRQFLVQHDDMKKLSDPSSNYVNNQETSNKTATEENVNFTKLIYPDNSCPTLFQLSERTELDEKKNMESQVVIGCSQQIRNGTGELKVSAPEHRPSDSNVFTTPIPHQALSVLPEDKYNFQSLTFVPRNNNNDVSPSQNHGNFKQQFGQVPIDTSDNLLSTSSFNRENQVSAVREEDNISSFFKHIENCAERLEENSPFIVPIHEKQENCHSISTSTPMHCFGTTTINNPMKKPKSLRAINIIQNSEQPTSSSGSVDQDQVWEEYRRDENTDSFNANLWTSSEQQTNRLASQTSYQHQGGVQNQAMPWESNPIDWQHQQKSVYNNQLDYLNGYTNSVNNYEVSDAVPQNEKNSQQFPSLAPYSHNFAILCQQPILPTFSAPVFQSGIIQQPPKPDLFPILPSNMQLQGLPNQTPIKQEIFPQFGKTDIIRFQGFLGEEKLTLNDYLSNMFPIWFSTRMVRFAVAKIMETVVEPERIQWLELIFEAIGSKIFEDYEKEKLYQIEARIRNSCWTLIEHRPTLKRRNLFNKELLIGSFIQEKHFMLLAIRNPNGAILKESEAEDTPSPMCSVFFLDPMGDFVGYRNRRALLMVLTFLECHFIALKKNKIVSEATVFHKSRVVLKRIANLPLQSNLQDCGPSVVSYVETLLDNHRGLLQLNIDEEVDWHQLDQNGENSIDMSRRKVRSMMIPYIMPQYRRGVSELEKLQERKRLTVTAPSSRRSRSLERETRKPIINRSFSFDFWKISNPREIQRYVNMRLAREEDEKANFKPKCVAKYFKYH